MREIYIERQKEMLRIAVKRNGKLEECFIEEESGEPLPGQIYKGRIKNIVPAIKCAFVDIGQKKNGYMYLDKKFNNTNVKKGQEVIVEVIKEDLADKGPKVSTAISIPGRYVVLTIFDREITFSKKIVDQAYMDAISDGLNKPEELGVVIRTNAYGKSVVELNKEIAALYETYQRIHREGEHTLKPRLLFSDKGVLDKVLRDQLDENTSRIIVNNDTDYQHVERYIEAHHELQIKVELYKLQRTMFDYYGIEKEILRLRERRVELACGGSIVIEKTEAMHVIDVNSGKNVKEQSMLKTIERTNLEAAREVARQVRLRNLSGIIVVDFIDIEEPHVKSKILNTLTEGFEGDKNKTIIYPFTELHLVQIARRRKGKTLYEYMEEDCECCSGAGKKLKWSYLRLLIRNEVIRLDEEGSKGDIYIEVNDFYKELIQKNPEQFAEQIEASNKRVYVYFHEKIDHYKVEALLYAEQVKNAQKYKIYG